MSTAFATVLKDQLGLLFFRKINPRLKEHKVAYLVWGLFVTWLVGIGRYWDHPNAEIWQYAGLGSVIYVFILAAIIWVLTKPLRPHNLSYFSVLIFVCFTSLPAIFYAIPVERFMSLPNAQTANIWFLAVVAGWRVALYAVFLHRAARLKAAAVIVATVLPLTLIVTALVMLNLENAVFELMGGLRETNATPNDAAYAIMIAISFLSILATPLFLIWYGVLVYLAQTGRRQS